MAGLTSTGFVKKTLPEIKAELEDSFKLAFGEQINLLPGSNFSQIIGIMSEREALIWDLAEDVYNSQYPDTAEGTSLDNAITLTGIERLGAKKSRVLSQLLFGSSGITVPAGTIFDVPGNPSARFVVDANVILGAGVNEVQHIAFSAVPTSGTWKLSFESQETSVLAFNANAAAVQAALNALTNLSGVVVTGNYTAGFDVTFAGADGKQDQALLVISLNSLLNGITAITITPTQTIAGVPQGVATMTAEVSGEIPAPRGTLTNIVTPVFGLASTKNSVDAVVGRAVETDAELRLRRRSSLQSAGSGTVEAIRAALLGVAGVTQAIVFENHDMIDDLNGLPPKSFEAFVQGGDNQDIGDKIWEVKGGGIKSFGSIPIIVVDTQGISQTVRFSRPTVVPVFINIEVTKDFDAPSNLLALVRNALAEYVNSLQIGEDVIVYPKLICVLDQFTGVIDIRIGINKTGSPPLTGSDNNIVIAINEVAKIVDAATDITVTVI